MVFPIWNERASSIENYVDRVTVVSRAEVMFELKCGLNLKERLVK